MKLLVRATNWVGDAMFSIPALAALRARRPQAEIAVLGRPWVLELYRGQEFADRLIPFDSRGRHRGVLGLERLAHELRAERFDAALLFQNAFQAAWIAWRARIPERIGYARDGRGPLLTRSVPVPPPGSLPRHEATYYLDLLRGAGWLDAADSQQALTPPRLNVSAADANRAEALLQRAGSPAGSLRVAIGPGAAFGSAKCWPANRFSELAQRLVRDCGAQVLVFGSNADAAVANEVELGAGAGVINLAGRTAIGELPALLSRCSLFIGNDSGATHVAAAVGAPVVALFGPTDPAGSHPLTPRLSVVQRKVACSPCFLRHCPIDHRCMKFLETEMVLEAARKWLAAPRAAAGAGQP
ncbi:MAG TPA: lipopolysaccharide heptosyltransferase II [Candidatus Binatia bacterium]|nr:lipopolysaccharide heptosyltransferase II [Candidatus Binatia bacterium]